MLIRLIRPILKLVLPLLDRIYQARRKSFIPSYPYDKRTNSVSLPSDIEKEIRYLVITGRKPEALKKVANLTGASLRTSKDYIDSLCGMSNIRRRHGTNNPRN